MYASAAVVSAAVNGGLYLDPSDDGLLLPESALTRARYWATIFDAQQRSAVLIAATPRKAVSETKNKLKIMPLIGISILLSWAIYRLHEAGYF